MDVAAAGGRVAVDRDVPTAHDTPRAGELELKGHIRHYTEATTGRYEPHVDSAAAASNRERKTSLSAPLPSHIVLAVLGALASLMVIIGALSYYKAVTS